MRTFVKSVKNLCRYESQCTAVGICLKNFEATVWPKPAEIAET